jgi:aspartate/methionine/tyrosine aminotransferase
VHVAPRRAPDRTGNERVHRPEDLLITFGATEAIAAALLALWCAASTTSSAISDEVYEHLVFDGEHVPPATLPAMAERTLTVSSVGKSFSFTAGRDRLVLGSGRAGGRDARAPRLLQAPGRDRRGGEAPG